MTNEQTTPNTNRPIWVQVLLDKSISPAGRLIFSYLFWRQGSNGSSWPSQYMIAENLGLCRRAVQQLTKQLAQKGYIYITRTDAKGRRQYLQYNIIEQPKKRNEKTQKGYTERPPFMTERAHTVRPLIAERAHLNTQKGRIQCAQTLRENTKRESAHSKAKTCVGKSLSTNSTTQENSAPKSALKSTKQHRFKPPTVDEVRAYAETINYYTLDVAQFVDYYIAKGWMIGKNKMKDWRAAVRTWKRRDEESGKKTGRPKRGESGWVPTEAEAEQTLRECGMIK